MAAARLVRVQVLREMSKTSVVSTDCPRPITWFTPLLLSAAVPEDVVMLMPFPPGHPAIVPFVESVVIGASVRMGVGRGGCVGVCAPSLEAPTAIATNARGTRLVIDSAGLGFLGQCRPRPPRNRKLPPTAPPT